MEPGEPDTWPSIQKSDKKAYEAAFRQWYRPLCVHALQLLRDKDESEEAVQQVFYNMWVKRENIQITGQLKSYLFRAVHNECLNRLKHHKVRSVYAEDYKALHSSPATGHDSLENKELGRRISEALETLPEQCGVVFRMNRFEQLKYSEIAGKLGISVKTVETHMGKALRLLREELKDYLPALLWLLLIY
jgi:RNA polymerase sigma-70 factor (family 1)